MRLRQETFHVIAVKQEIAVFTEDIYMINYIKFLIKFVYFCVADLN